MRGDINTRLKALGVAIALTIAAGSSATAQQDTRFQFPNYAVSFAPGGADADGHFLGGTEIRDLTVFKGKLYASVNYWMDQPGAEGYQQAQLIVLDGPDAKWREDVNFGAFCTAPKRCALGAGALSILNFKKDRNGAAANVSVLVSSIWPIGETPAPIKVYAKNNTDGLWSETIIATAENGQARAFGAHVDKVTGESLSFVGAGSIGIYHGWLSPQRGAGKNIVQWVTGAANAEWNSDASPCGGGNRIMAFAEAEGELFASRCFTVFKRTDGAQADCKPDEVKPQGKEECEQRWRKFYDLPDAPGSQSGFRGMTAVKANGKDWLILGGESGSSVVITRLDPRTGEAQTELDVTRTLRQAWNMPIGYVITSYSAPMPVWIDQDGRSNRIIGLEAGIKQDVPVLGHSMAILDNGGRWQGDAWYFLREAAYTYRLFKLPPIMPGRMLAVRAAASSPWECNDQGQACAVYFGGYDANKGAAVSPCFAAPCANPFTPTHNTAWIVKGYF